MTRLTERIAANVRSARLKAGLSQEALARLADLSAATVSRIERGFTSKPRDDEFARLARALGTTTDALMGIEPEQPDEDADESEADIDAELDELTRDADLMLAFMGHIRDPKRMARDAKVVIRNDLRRIRARQQRQQG